MALAGNNGQEWVTPGKGNDISRLWGPTDIDANQFVLETAASIELVYIEASKPRTIFQSLKRYLLSGRQASSSRKTVPYTPFPPDPRYDVMIAWSPVGSLDAPLPEEDLSELWKDTEYTTGVEPYTKEPVVELAVINPPVTLVPKTAEESLEKRPNDQVKKPRGFGERIRHNRLALGLSAMVLAGLTLFAATNLDNSTPVVQSPKIEAQTTFRPTVGSSALAMPGHLQTTFKLPSANVAPAAETSTAAQIPSPEPATVSFTIAPNGNLPWAIKTQLKLMDISGQTSQIDKLADTITEEIQSATPDRDLNTVFAGESFKINASQVQELARQLLAA